MITLRSQGIKNMNSYTIECNQCSFKENFTGRDETEAESKAFKQRWNIQRVGPRIEHYCPSCFRNQEATLKAKESGNVG